MALRGLGQSQAREVIAEGSAALSPVIEVLQELICSEQVAGSIEDGTIGDVSGHITVCAAGELAAELPSIDGRGAEFTVTTLPQCLLHLTLDGVLQTTSFGSLE